MSDRECPCCCRRLTARQFIDALARRRRPRDWRAGQAAFNLLLDVHPELAEMVRGGRLDPYHDDSRLPAFEEFVRAHWRAGGPPRGGEA